MWSFNWSNYYGDQFLQALYDVFLGDRQVALCIAKILAIGKVAGDWDWDWDGDGA